MNRKHLKLIKRYCIHEAGHAIVSPKLGIPITRLYLRIKFDGDWIGSDGGLEFGLDKLNEDLRSEDYSVRSQAFLQDLALNVGRYCCDTGSLQNKESL